MHQGQSLEGTNVNAQSPNARTSQQGVQGQLTRARLRTRKANEGWKGGQRGGRNGGWRGEKNNNDHDMRLMLEALDAMSVKEDDDGDDDGLDDGDKDGADDGEDDGEDDDGMTRPGRGRCAR